jgi:selenide, water dikinase
MPDRRFSHVSEVKIDLLTLVEQGGCSAKLSAAELDAALSGLHHAVDPNVLVDIRTHDDAGVYKISDEFALIQTTDFFPPVCSEPYDFGQIAAANALSDVYAMGGQVLTVMNIVLFPATLSLAVLKEILRGGEETVIKAGGTVVGGHTIANDIPVYGLAVSGKVHPDHITTNSNAKPGDQLILTKPLGTGVIISARKNGLAHAEGYTAALNNMKQLNASGAKTMNKYSLRTATDITGFGLIGHAKKMAEASHVTIRIFANQVPALPQVMDLIGMGCIPGAAFRNKEFATAGCQTEPGIDYNTMMLLYDAQTSGGLLMAAPAAKAEQIVSDLRNEGYVSTAIVGEVVEKKDYSVCVG